MKNKFFLLSSLLGLTLTGISSADEGFYVSVQAGPNWVDRNNHRNSISDTRLKVDFKTGYFVGASVGYQWCNNFSVEGEFTYRRNQIDKLHFKNADTTFEFDNFRRDRNLENYAGMVNVRYDWALECMSFMPYIRGGIGYANTRFALRWDERFFDTTIGDFCTNNCRHRRNQSKFAYQAGAGITVPDILCNTHLDIGYNYFGTTSDNNRRDRGNQNNHSLFVAAKYVF